MMEQQPKTKPDMFKVMDEGWRIAEMTFIRERMVETFQKVTAHQEEPEYSTPGLGLLFAYLNLYHGMRGQDAAALPDITDIMSALIGLSLGNVETAAAAYGILAMIFTKIPQRTVEMWLKRLYAKTEVCNSCRMKDGCKFHTNGEASYISVYKELKATTQEVLGKEFKDVQPN